MERNIIEIFSLYCSSCTIYMFGPAVWPAVSSRTLHLVWLELAVTGVKLTPWTQGEIISLCLTKTESQVIKKGVTVLRNQIVNQK